MIVVDNMASATDDQHVNASLEGSNENEKGGAEAAVSSPRKSQDDDVAEPVVTLKTWIVCAVCFFSQSGINSFG